MHRIAKEESMLLSKRKKKVYGKYQTGLSYRCASKKALVTLVYRTFNRRDDYRYHSRICPSLINLLDQYFRKTRGLKRYLGRYPKKYLFNSNRAEVACKRKSGTGLGEIEKISSEKNGMLIFDDYIRQVVKSTDIETEPYPKSGWMLY